VFQGDDDLERHDAYTAALLTDAALYIAGHVAEPGGGATADARAQDLAWRLALTADQLDPESGAIDQVESVLSQAA
jgi:hypothetical protein